MKTATVVCVILAASGLLPMATTAQPTITIYTDADTYQSGDTIEVSLSAQNDGQGMSVAVYVGLMMPDGEVYTTQFDGWSEGLEPWIPDTFVPSGFVMERTPFWWFDLPCSMPPIEEVGNYTFATVLTYPKTFDWVSTASLAPFTVLASVGSHHYVDAELGDNSNDGSFGTPWKTITHALHSVDGSEETPATVHVAAGVYSSSTNSEAFPLNMKSWVSLRGEDRETTILNAESAAVNVIFCQGVDDLVISGFTITGGLSDESSGATKDLDGAGICCVESSIVIQDNIISANEAVYGGAVYSRDGSPLIEGNRMSSNSANRGGAIYCSHGSPTIRGNTISGNAATALTYWGQGKGGGICCCCCSPTISGNTISGNAATAPEYYYDAIGGGICCDRCSSRIFGNIVAGNGTRGFGGGILAIAGSSIISGNVIAGNEAYSGGGLECAFSWAAIKFNSITDNSADYGGGLCSRYGEPLEIVHNVFVRNRAHVGGGGICSMGSPPTITGCVLWDNLDDLDGCEATYSCIQNPDEGEGNIHDDPRFLPGPFGDYYLDPSSPCIDAGGRSAGEAGMSEMTTQVDGTPDTGLVDIGVHYEIPASFCPTSEIDLIEPNPAVRGVDIVHLVGHAVDPDGSIEEHEWFSDLDGVLGSMSELCVIALKLRPGTHSIGYRARGNDGAWSEPDYSDLVVLPYPMRYIYVDGATGDDSNDGSESRPVKTITHAIALALGNGSEPGVVSIAHGIYSASTNGETFPLRMESWISLIGDASQSTILDAEEEAYHVIYCSEVTGATIEGLTIKGGNADGFLSSDFEGAGVFCLRSVLQIQDCVIADNTATGSGGGIACRESSLRAFWSTISDNSAGDCYDGGGIYSNGGSFSVIGCKINANSAHRGGGVYCSRNSSTKILDSVISSNTVDWSGAGIYCNDGYLCTISGNVISANLSAPYSEGSGEGVMCGDSPLVIADNLIADNLGSGICCFGDGPVTVRDNIITGNSGGYGGGINICNSGGDHPLIFGNTIASNSAGSGGGIACRFPRCVPLVLCNLIVDNTASYQGGAMWFEDCNPVIQFNTVVGNSAKHCGGVFADEGSSRPEITNCIIWGNGDDLKGCSASYCCIEDPDEGEANIHDDPKFMSGPYGSYYIDSRSACVDAGSESAEEAGLSDMTTQADGVADTSVVDIGAHFSIPDGEIPTAIIEEISPNPAVRGQDIIHFVGLADDQDGIIESYEWSSDIDGVLGVGTELMLFSLDLSPGVHEIRFRAKDNDGLWSTPDYSSLTVERHPILRVLVNPETGDDSSDGSEAHPLRTIGHAIELARGTESEPGVVSVAAGVYSPSTNGEVFPLQMRSWLALAGEAPESAVVDAEGAAHHVIICEEVVGCRIQGLTITGGNADGADEPGNVAGGILCHKSEVEVRGNIITGNVAAEAGGGIACLESPATLVGNALTDNLSDRYGGGIYCKMCSPEISDNEISNNESKSDGGGIYCLHSSPNILMNSISGNDSRGSGGGIYCIHESSPAIFENIISGNTARSDGGGIYCYRGSSPTITDNLISDNEGEGIHCYYQASPTILGNFIARNVGSGIYCCYSGAIISENEIEGNMAEYGGGLHIDYTFYGKAHRNTVSANTAHCGGGAYVDDFDSGEFSDNIIVNNTAEQGGGVFFDTTWGASIRNCLIFGNWANEGGAFYCAWLSPCEIHNCTMVANSAKHGGGIFSEGETFHTIIDCILWGNGDELYDCTGTHCCIEDDDAGVGNIHDNPMFVIGPFGDYYLHPESPCIDAGSKSALAARLSERTTQADGDPDSGQVDIGYHYPLPAEDEQGRGR